MNSFRKVCGVVAGLSVALLVQTSASAQAAKPEPKADASKAAEPKAPAASGMPSATECVAPEAEKTLATCPNTGPSSFDVTKHGKNPGASFQSAPPPQELKKRDQQTKPNNPAEEFKNTRDERRNRLAARVRALLISEIQGLDSLMASTPPKSPDRPQLLRRLAEDYVELESAAFRDKTEAGIKLDAAKKGKGDVAKLTQNVNQAQQIMVAARKKAIDYYTKLKNEYPNSATIDEVLYYLAYEYEQATDYQNARKVYYELIQKAPQSKYIPNAYLAFGELFFNEAQGDPSKWDLAAGAYSEVVKYPPPNNKVFGYAHYKLAYVYWNKGDFPHALDEFKKTIDYGNGYPSVPNAAPLATAARRDLVPVYALSGRPDAAYNFFHNLSGDKAGETAKTFKMMDELGTNYLDTGHYAEAIALYHDLMIRDKNSDNLCRYQVNVSRATLAMKSGNKDSIKIELDRQLEVYNTFKGQKHADEMQVKCANETAELITETAMAWHLEAVGSNGVRGTGDQKTMTLSSYLYKRVIDNFPTEQFKTFEFPRIVKADWPTIFKIKYAMADLLYFQQRWAECGPAFDAVVDEAPNSPEAPEAAYASVLCYQNVYEGAHAGGKDRQGSGNLPGQGKGKKETKAEENAKYKAKEFTPSQKGMVQAFNRYICYIKPKPDDKVGTDQLIEVKYARARVYFEAQHWDEAALAFRDVAMNHSDRDVGIYAAQLYLESVNVLGTHTEPPKPGCFVKMADDVPQFIKLYCDAAGATKNADQCSTLTKIQCDIQRLKAQKTVELADNGGVNALRLYEQGGNDYIAIWRKYGEEPIRNHQPPTCEKMDEIVYNAARAFQAGRLVAKAIQARLILINPTNTLDKTENAKKAVYEIGGNYQAIAVYDEAANWYEKYAKENPKSPNADKALSDATLLRLGLGQEDEAIKDGDAYNRQFGSAHAVTTAQIAFGIGAHYADKEDWPKAQKRLSGAMSLIEKNATYDVKVQAHAMLGRAMANQRGGLAKAGSEYAKVRAAWSDPKDAEGQVMKIPDEDDASKIRRLGKALTAVGEALFYFAELKRVEVEKIAFPVYHGPTSKEAVLKHIKGPVLDWMKKKQPAIEKAEEEYVKIVKLEPTPPPRWVIAAGASVGGLWGNFVHDFRAAPIPASFKKDVELRNAYYGALDEASEPHKQRAKKAFETCLQYSVKYQFFDEYSRKCEVWLSKTYKNEYHVVDEFRPSPTNVGSGLNDQPYPLQTTGEPYNEAPAPPPPPAVDSSKEKDDADDDKGKKGGGGKGAAKKPKKK